MGLRRCATLAVFAAVSLLVACSGREEEKRAAPPSQADIDKLQRQSYPVYWMGWRYRGMRLSRAELFPDRALIGYGRESCDSPPGCITSVVTVASFRGRPDALPRRGEPRRSFGPLCFRWVRSALFIGCPTDQEGGDLLTGPQQVVGVPSGGVGDLRRLDHSARRKPGSALPPPDRVTCKEQRGLARWFLRRLPTKLTVAGC